MHGPTWQGTTTAHMMAEKQMPWWLGANADLGIGDGTVQADLLRVIWIRHDIHDSHTDFLDVMQQLMVEPFWVCKGM